MHKIWQRLEIVSPANLIFSTYCRIQCGWWSSFATTLWYSWLVDGCISVAIFLFIRKGDNSIWRSSWDPIRSSWRFIFEKFWWLVCRRRWMNQYKIYWSCSVFIKVCVISVYLDESTKSTHYPKIVRTVFLIEIRNWNF